MRGVVRARRPAEAAGIGKGLDAHGVMRQNSNHKRPRNRGNLGRKPSNNRNQTFDSNGPSVRIRGNAFQVHEKYLTLARDAYASGDRVMAENYFQHAEHYYRVVNATTDPSPNNRVNGHANGYDHGASDDFDGDDQNQSQYSHGQRPQEQPAAQAEDGKQNTASGGEGQPGERSGGERRRRGRRSNGHDNTREQVNGDGRAEPAEQAADSNDSADSAEAPAATDGPQEQAAAATEAAETSEKPRRRTRRRSPRAAAPEGNAEGSARDGDEEPVLI